MFTALKRWWGRQRSHDAWSDKYRTLPTTYPRCRKPLLRLQAIVLTYSDHIVQLKDWVIQASDVIEHNRYCPESWSKTIRVMQEHSLDDCFTPGGYDVDLSAFWVEWVAALEAYDRAWRIAQQQDSSLVSYYQRKYVAIEHDLQALYVAITKDP